MSLFCIYTLGLSDDESVSPTKKPSKKVVEDSEPVRKATLALDDLLGGKSKSKESKGRKPTFLEQMMSKNTGKRQSAGWYFYLNLLRMFFQLSWYLRC